MSVTVQNALSFTNNSFLFGFLYIASVALNINILIVVETCNASLFFFFHAYCVQSHTYTLQALSDL